MMKRWLRRIRGALGMGLSWGIVGALVGGFVEAFVDPTGAIADIWPMVLGLPAFLCGTGFSVVLGIAARDRRFDELSIPQFAAWGALGGVLVGLIPATMVALGWTNVTDLAVVVRTTAILTTSLGTISAVLAAGTLALARRAEDQALLEAGEEVRDVGLSAEEARKLLDGRS